MTTALPINRVVRDDVHHLLGTLGDAVIDLAVADPAYGLRKGEWDAAPDYAPRWIGESLRVLRPGGSCYVFGRPEVVAAHWGVFPSPKRLIFWQVSNRVVPSAKTWQPTTEAIVMCWRGAVPYFDASGIREPYGPDFQRHRGHRRPPTPGRFGRRVTRYSDAEGALPRDVLRGPGLSGQIGARESLGHPAQKPLWLMERLIKASCPPGGLVLDLFAGVATTSVAAHRLGRRWIAVENDAGYCRMAIKRLRAEGASVSTTTGPGASGYECGSTCSNRIFLPY